MKSVLPILRMSDYACISLERDLDGGRLEVVGILTDGRAVTAIFTPSPELRESWETLEWR